MRWCLPRILAPLLLAGCFGKGPSPTASPSDGEILFAIQPPDPSGECSVSPFIGSVAFANGEGYLATHGFLPLCKNGQGDSSQRIDSEIIHIPDGAVVSMAGTTTEGGGQHPVVAIAGGTVEWVYSASDGGSGAAALELGTIADPAQPIAGAANSEAALFFDGTTTIVATASVPPGPSEPIAPRFPCCGSQGGGGNPMAQLISLNPPVTGAATLPIHCTQIKDCIAVTADAVFYWVDNQGTHLERASRPDLAATTDYPNFLGNAREPAGMAANATTVAWTESQNFVGDGLNVPSGCKVSTLPSDAPAQAQSEVLFESSDFSCLDLALDDTHAYFTIVKLISGDGGGDKQIVGIGLGRVELTGAHTVETLDLGFTDVDAGPRELLLDGDDLITIAPFAVGRFKKTVLDGAADF